MRFEVDRTDFINALDNANKATAGKQMPALGDVHISAQGNKVNITGYDLSTAIFTHTRAKVTEEGEVCCSADTVSRFLQKCDDVTAEIIVDTRMTVKCGRSKITVAVAPAEDYPKPQKLPPESPAIFIDYDLLSSMLKRTVFAASNDAVKPELRCVNLSISNGVIKITAGDGYRVAICTEEAENVGKAVKSSFNIFKENVQTALKILKASEPVTKSKEEYTRAQWQLDANAFWRSDGNSLLTKDEIGKMTISQLQKTYRKYSISHIYKYEDHVAQAKQLDKDGRLPATFALMPPASWSDKVWDDINRMKTLNTTQSHRQQALHVCPLQIDIVERIINRYSNPGDLVLDPFGGLMTVPLTAIKMGRRGYGIELNPDYFRDGVGYLKQYEDTQEQLTLFDVV